MMLGEELVSLTLCRGAGRPADVRPASTVLSVPFARTKRHGGALCLGHPGLLARVLAAIGAGVAVRALDIVMVVVVIVVLVMVLVMMLGEELVSLTLCRGAGRPADVRPASTILSVPFARTKRHGGPMCLGHPGLLARVL